MLNMLRQIWDQFDGIQFPLFLLTIIYIFLFFTGSATALYLDNRFTLDNILLQYVFTWTINLLSGIAIALAIVSRLQLDADAIWRLITFNAFFILFGMTLTRNVVHAEQLRDIYMVLLVSFIITQIIIISLSKREVKRWSIILLGLAVSIVLVVTGMIHWQPISITKTHDNGEVTVWANHRYMYPCATIGWRTNGDVVRLQVVDGDGESLPLNGEQVYCYHNPDVDRDYVILDAYFADGENQWNPIRLSGITHREMLGFVLAAVAFVLIPAWVVSHRTYGVMLALGGVWLLPFVQYPADTTPDNAMLWIIVITAAFTPLYFLYRMLADHALPRMWSQIADGFVMVLLIPSLFINLSFPYDRWHHNYTLGPTNDLLHGKTMFVDTITQYGIGLNYSLAGFFATFPNLLSYQGFSLLLSLMLVAAMIIMYIFLRSSGASLWVSLAVLVVLASTQVYRPVLSGLTNPTLGALRYIWQYIILLILIYRVQSGRSTLQWLEAFVIGASIFWSLDSVIMVGLAYTAVMLYEGLTGITPLRQIALRIVWIVASTGAFYGGYTLYAFVKTGILPDYGIYLEVLNFYSDLGWDFIPTYSMWLFPGAVYMISVLLVVFAILNAQHPGELRRYIPVTMLTSSGILQLMYWVRVSGDGNFHPFVMVGIVLTGYWVAQLKQLDRIPRQALEIGVFYIFCGFWVAVILFPDPTFRPNVTPSSAVWTALRSSSAPDFNLDALQTTPPSHLAYAYTSMGNDKLIDEAVQVVQQYAPDQDRIPLFIPSETATDVLMRVKKAEQFILGHPNMPTHSEPFRPWVLAKPLPIQAGDLMFISVDRSTLDPIQISLLEQVEDVFMLDIIAHPEGPIQVIRLEPRQD